MRMLSPQISMLRDPTEPNSSENFEDLLVIRGKPVANAFFKVFCLLKKRFDPQALDAHNLPFS